MTTTAPKPMGTLRDRFLQLAELITTPLVPADYLDIINPLRSSADLRGRIVAIHPETRDAVSLVIKPGRGWRAHTPGQYVRIGVDVDGVRQWRAYSLTSDTARADDCIAITVKAIPDGKVSNHLVRHATVGTIVQLDHAAGEFTLPAVTPPKILFLTAGSGITPVMGMLRNLAEHIDDVVVVHSAPTAADVIFAGELQALARQGRIRLIEKHTDTDGMLTPPSSATWSATCPSVRRGHADRPGCSTRSSSTGTTTAYPSVCTPKGSGPPSSPPAKEGRSPSANPRPSSIPRATRHCSTPAKRPAS
ncbi:ferredoxin reductase [Mycobacterium sp.]|uniref:ferredoxin reductase n=1 Tax=Mycobacterium sp. TaxID=1785 RepID=UPI003D134E78